MRPTFIMRAHPVIGAASVALALLAPRATAAPRESADSPLALPARARAFELAVATGYTQGFGTLQPGVGMPQVATAGIGVEGTVGYRIDPHFSFTAGAQYQELQAERDDSARSFVWGLALQYHIAPSSRLDPWLELGAGYRILWLEPFETGPTTALHGPQLVRVRAGLDVRLSRDVAIAPVIGADASMFTFRDDTRFQAIADPTLSTFVFAGLQGRVDIGGISLR
jgi:hypothetical protein